MSESLLDVNDLDVFYGPIQALRGVSMSIAPGERIALVGANGAGKTTTLRTISGLLKPTRGEVIFDGKPIGGLKAHKVVQRGIDADGLDREAPPAADAGDPALQRGVLEPRARRHRPARDHVARR